MDPHDVCEFCRGICSPPEVTCVECSKWSKRRVRQFQDFMRSRNQMTKDSKDAPRPKSSQDGRSSKMAATAPHGRDLPSGSQSVPQSLFGSRNENPAAASVPQALSGLRNEAPSSAANPDNRDVASPPSTRSQKASKKGKSNGESLPQSLLGSRKDSTSMMKQGNPTEASNQESGDSSGSQPDDDPPSTPQALSGLRREREELPIQGLPTAGASESTQEGRRPGSKDCRESFLT